MASIDIDLVQPLIAQARTSKQNDTSSLRAHGLVQWLLTHYFPSKIRKSSLRLLVTSPDRGHIRIQVKLINKNKLQGAGRVGGNSDNEKEQCFIDGPNWEKSVFQALKKVIVEDLGNMNATDLQAFIPPQDSEGKGMSNLRALEKKTSVKVVFDDVTGHVLLVGEGKKLEKKVFVIRNMLSHYHWRLSGMDVAFDKATSSR